MVTVVMLVENFVIKLIVEDGFFKKHVTIKNTKDLLFRRNEMLSSVGRNTDIDSMIAGFSHRNQRSYHETVMYLRQKLVDFIIKVEQVRFTVWGNRKLVT